MDAAPRFIVGLGNPGRRYEGTRHNLGFMVVERLASLWNASGPKRAFDGLLWDAPTTFGRVMLLEPMLFMNRSGRSVGQMATFYKAPPTNILVVLDDMALPPGKIRIRPGGSAGGHNGLADILRVLGTPEAPRLRLGIGAPPPRMDAADYVLGKMDEDERAAAGEAIDKSVAAIETWLTAGVEEAMNKHN